MGIEFIEDVLAPLAVFGGIAMIIWTSARAKLEHRKIDLELRKLDIQKQLAILASSNTGSGASKCPDTLLEQAVQRI